jgi:hypothetical protein
MAQNGSAAALLTRPQGLAPLNPERPPQLLGKYAKYLGKDLEKIEITYNADGLLIGVYGKAGTPYESLENASIAEFKALRQTALQPSTDEKLQAFRNKFELRLNRECNPAPNSGSDADIQAFLNGLGFRERRALLMTQKQFSASYPNGYTAA